MIAIAESVSSKTDWLIIKDDQEITFQSKGYNPQFIDSNFIQNDLHSHFPESSAIEQVFFYGAGCASASSQDKMKNMLAEIFTSAEIEVESDLLAACRAMLGHSAGIVGILGTGSNCCYYDGKTISQKTTNLGFLMGDEGSGNNIAKRVLRKCLYNDISEHIQNDILGEASNRNEFVTKIYNQDRINTYLASFMKKIYPHRNDAEVAIEVKASFSAFFKHHVAKYTESDKLYLVGSISTLIEDQLRDLSVDYNKTLVSVSKSPINGLKRHHLQG